MKRSLADIFAQGGFADISAQDTSPNISTLLFSAGALVSIIGLIVWQLHLFVYLLICGLLTIATMVTTSIVSGQFAIQGRFTVISNLVINLSLTLMLVGGNLLIYGASIGAWPWFAFIIPASMFAQALNWLGCLPCKITIEPRDDLLKKVIKSCAQVAEYKKQLLPTFTCMLSEGALLILFTWYGAEAYGLDWQALNQVLNHFDSTSLLHTLNIFGWDQGAWPILYQVLMVITFITLLNSIWNLGSSVLACFQKSGHHSSECGKTSSGQSVGYRSASELEPRPAATRECLHAQYTHEEATVYPIQAVAR